MEELEHQISANVSILSEFFRTSSYPAPTFDRHSPPTTLPATAPENVRKARKALIEASYKLSQLAIGPNEFLPNIAVGYHYIACLQWLCQFNIFHLVPLQGAIKYAELAVAAKVPELRLKSIVRMAMTANLFSELTPDHVSHSATSALIAEDPNFYAWASYMSETSAPVALKTAEASAKWPECVGKTETAYNVEKKTDLPFFEHTSADPERMKQFARYMKNVQSSEGTHIKHVLTGFDWAKLGKAVVVDVGGSTGNACITLAKSFPDLTFIVQDLPSNAADGHASLSSQPESISSRITFQGHDFFQPQPYLEADVYFMRMILHDWPKEQSTTILKNIVTAMKPSSRLLIMDSVVPAPGSVPSSTERLIRARDLTMWQTFNSYERDLDIWKELFAAVDTRLRLVNVVQPFESVMSIMEIVLES